MSGRMWTGLARDSFQWRILILAALNLRVLTHVVSLRHKYSSLQKKNCNPSDEQGRRFALNPVGFLTFPLTATENTYISLRKLIVGLNVAGTEDAGYSRPTQTVLESKRAPNLKHFSDDDEGIVTGLSNVF